MDLIARYRQMAEKGVQLWGLSILQHANEIQLLIETSKSRTLLDFGCGAGAAYRSPAEIHLHWKVQVPALYDPAFVEHDKLPDGTFDGVLCSDVLEHVPIQEVAATIRTLFERADRFVWASVCCRPAKKTFEDGTNLHVTIKPYAWWQAQFQEIAAAVSAQRFGKPNAITWKLTETP